MTGLAIAIGLNGALETLVSQSYGANNLKLCGVYLNRGRYVLCLCFIPVTLVLSQAENILVAIGQNPDVAKHAQ